MMKKTPQSPQSVDRKRHEAIYAIALSMTKAGLPPKFVQRAQAAAFEFEGMYDLLLAWSEEQSDQDKGNIIAVIEEEVDDIRDHGEGHELKPRHRPKINFDDIEEIGTNTLAFKKKLRAIESALDI